MSDLRGHRASVILVRQVNGILITHRFHLQVAALIVIMNIKDQLFDFFLPVNRNEVYVGEWVERCCL